jgi:serine/threonine protein kinase
LLADFGVSIIGDATVGRMTTDRGAPVTMHYSAPECLHHETGSMRKTPAVDVYALGCLFYEVRIFSQRKLPTQVKLNMIRRYTPSTHLFIISGPSLSFLQF